MYISTLCAARIVIKTKDINSSSSLKPRMRPENIFQELNLQRLLETSLPDFILSFAFFTSVVYSVLGKKFDHQRSAITMSASLGLALSFGLIWWEQSTGYSVKNLGPVAVGFALIILAYVMYHSVQKVGGSWAGAGIAMGASLLIASVLGTSWPIDAQIIQTIITVSLIVGILSFLMNQNRHLAVADARHDMRDLHWDRRTSKSLSKRLGRLKKQASSLSNHPEKARDLQAQLKEILPVEGQLTEQLAKLRTKAHRMRNGHVMRLKETYDILAKSPKSEKKKAAIELANRYRQLAGIDTRLERLDTAVAKYEQRIISLTQMAQTYGKKGNIAKLTDILREAQKFQHHNTRLFKLIERTENMLSAVASKVVQQTREAQKK